METLQHYLSCWNLSDPEQIAKTATSWIYRVKQSSKACALKIFTDIGKDDEILGADFLKTCVGQGVVSVFENDENAVLMNFIEGQSLKALTQKGQDEQATMIIGEILNKIHAVPIPKNHGFMNLEQRFRSLFIHPGDAPDIIKRGAVFAKNLLEKQTHICLLHGDIHHENILHDEKDGWVVIDPKGIVGDRAYDCANTLHNPHNMTELTENKDRLLKQAGILGEMIGIDPQRIINYAFAHGCLSSCWYKEEDGEYHPDKLATAKILEFYIK